MRKGFIRTYTLHHPERGDLDVFEIVEVKSGVPHVSRDWGTHFSRAEALKAAADEGVTIGDPPCDG